MKKKMLPTSLREKVEAEKPDWHAAIKRSEVQTLFLFLLFLIHPYTEWMADFKGKMSELKIDISQHIFQIGEQIIPSDKYNFTTMLSLL